MPKTKIFALTTRGLESVSAREMADLPGMTIDESSYRRVAAIYDGSPISLLRLRTIDDLYLNLETWTGIGHTRDMLPLIREQSAKLDLLTPAANCAEVRSVSASPLFSVTASFVGKRNYSSDEIKTAVGEGITTKTGWAYASDDRQADFNIRIFIEHEMAYVGVRLGKSPLHERRYKQVQRPGSLKPTVAAAMLRLAEVAPGHRLLDPCCGVGTILIEGAQMGAAVMGGDLDPEAVSAARRNAATVGAITMIEQWDARRLPLPDQSIDRIVTNLPWGRQIPVDEGLEKLYQAICAEMERVLAPKWRIAVLTSTPHLLHFDGLKPEDMIEISLFGQTPTISIFSATR